MARQVSCVDMSVLTTEPASWRSEQPGAFMAGTCEDSTLRVALAEHMVDSERLVLAVQSHGLCSGLEHVACAETPVTSMDARSNESARSSCHVAFRVRLTRRLRARTGRRGGGGGLVMRWAHRRPARSPN